MQNILHCQTVNMYRLFYQAIISEYLRLLDNYAAKSDPLGDDIKSSGKFAIEGNMQGGLIFAWFCSTSV